MATAVESQKVEVRRVPAADAVIWGFGTVSVIALVFVVLSSTSGTASWALPVSVAGFVEAVMATCIAWIAREMLKKA